MEDFYDFVAGVMGVDASEINVDTRQGEFEKWDSLMHLKLIMEIEEKYDVEIPIDKAASISTLGELHTIVEAQL